MNILTWNIQWGRGIDGQVDLLRTAREIRAFEADVICLQEIAVNHPGLPGGAAEDQAARLAGMFRAYHPVFGVGSDLPGDGDGRRLFGQLILSRLPLLEVFRHLLPWPADPAVSSMQRVALEAVIRGPFGPMRVVTTHLEYYSAKQRAAQVECLRQIQAEGYAHAVAPRSGVDSDTPFAVLPRGELSVFCGDFNSPAGSAEHARMQQPIATADGISVPRLIDAWEVVKPGVPRAPTAGVHKATFTSGPATYDFFFVSENLASRVAGVEVDVETTASDHQPVLLALRDE